MALYDRPEPPPCDRDEDCAGGCCKQIGTTSRQCEAGSACTLHWTTSPPSTIPHWQLSNFAGYTGSYAADVVHSRIEEALKSANATIWKLENQQYWIDDFASVDFASVGPNPVPSPVPGDECWIVPGRQLYSFYVADSADPIFVRQIPVVLDTAVSAASGSMTQDGVYELEGAGYWRVTSNSRSTNRRVLLASPNGVDYWIFTEGASESYVDPVLIRADSNVTRADAQGFSLANGQAWSYDGSPSLKPSVGDHVIIYQSALIDDEHPGLPFEDRAWVEGKSMFDLIWVVPVR